MRNYIRHPTSIPIHVCSGASHSGPVEVQNLSEGGLCFLTDESVQVGSRVEFLIPMVKPDYHGEGVVVWLRQQAPHLYEVGMRFTSDDEFFRTRMVEQVCCIEDYRQNLSAQGRELNTEEAAKEWIAKFAAHFDEGLQ